MTTIDTDVSVLFRPIIDVSRGTAAGYQARAVSLAARVLDAAGGSFGLDPASQMDPGQLAVEAAAAITAALGAAPTLPPNTFLAVPVPVQLAAHPHVHATLAAQASLSGVVLDIVGVPSDAEETFGVRADDVECALAEYRALGAMISVGGNGAAQPELTSIVRLKPAIIRLGRDWVRGIDTSEDKRSTIELIGHLAGQLDAWILCEGVATAAELRTLASLGVPLAQGPFIGEPQPFWPEVDLGARVALPKGRPVTAAGGGGLRELVQQVYTATDAAAAAAVLPETSGFDVVVIVDERRRPVSLLESGTDAQWHAHDVLPVNVDTPVADVVSRAMARPRITRFSPVTCTDERGRLVGIARIERLVTHLVQNAG